MQRQIPCKSICVILLAVLTFCFTASAVDQKRIKFQGIVMEVSLKNKTMVVGEKTVTWNEKTAIYNDKVSPIPIENIRVKNWVYIDGSKENENRKVTATKIYLLPKYIDRKEKGRYSFMNEK